MDKNYDHISPEQLRQLASSPTARALMTMLQQNHSVEADNAIRAAQNGDMQQAKDALGAFMKDPKVQQLLRQLQEDSHG